jgi:hypothetical protein
MAGPYQPLAEILPPAPAAGSLLQSAGTIAGEWKSGVSMPAHDWTNSEWPDCVDDWETSWSGRQGTTTLPDKPLSSSSAYPNCETWYFDPFTVYTPLSEVEVQPDLARRLANDAQRAHEMMFSRAVARALWNPEQWEIFDYLPPFIQDTDRNPTLGFAEASGLPLLDPLSAFSALFSLYALEVGTTAGMMFHVAPVVLPYLLHNAIVKQTGQRYIGPGDSIIVADAGYPTGQVPRDIVDDSFGSPEPSNPESWMFVTGPVEVAYDTARTIDGGAVSDTRWNQWALLIEQRAIFRFDPRTAFGTLVCVPAVACPDYSSVQ